MTTCLLRDCQGFSRVEMTPEFQPKIYRLLRRYTRESLPEGGVRIRGSYGLPERVFRFTEIQHGGIHVYDEIYDPKIWGAEPENE